MSNGQHVFETFMKYGSHNEKLILLQGIVIESTGLEVARKELVDVETASEQ